MKKLLLGNIVDIPGRRIFEGELLISDGKISELRALNASENFSLPYILPGFIDAHVHIESSMLVPSEFARLAVVHGTVATVSDPHEIANVCGMKGIQFMIDNGRSVNFKFNFGAPSCVPATSFETAGDTIGADDIDELLRSADIKYLSEMMNFPGVIFNDQEVMSKIAIAHKYKKPIDGHAPALGGEPLKKYVSAGISTDHECFTAKEAREKIGLGMKILIREGSAAKNFDALIELLQEYPEQTMFCSDDKHPDSLVRSHINELCARAVQKGIDPFYVLQAACINPITHYGLDVGRLQLNDPADLIIVNNLTDFAVSKTFINGVCVADAGQSLLSSVPCTAVNNFSREPIGEECLHINKQDLLIDGKLPVVGARDGQLITDHLLADPSEEDLLKLVVINRYMKAEPAIAFIKNFGLQSGAIASSVAHDCHNIIAVGVNDTVLARAINLIIHNKGGISCVSDNFEEVLPLPVAGLMSTNDGYSVASSYTRIDALAKSLGSPLSAPFMTLSFMALLVIPDLKLSDKGLFDGEKFRFVYSG